MTSAGALRGDEPGRRVAPGADACMPDARCAFEWMLRHEPQRAEGVHEEHDRVWRQAAQLQSEAHEAHTPAYALARTGHERPRLLARARSSIGASAIDCREERQRESAQRRAWCGAVARAVGARCVPRSSRSMPKAW